MDLFVGSMLTLVLADNLLLLYLGWEGVGLCSYLLIGFWYSDAGNMRRRQQGLHCHPRRRHGACRRTDLLLFVQLDTLSNIQEILAAGCRQWPRGSEAAVWAALLLLGGAVGKSAQLPLQTWLPDAMAGPTPGERPHPCGDHGHGRGLSHREDPRDLHPGPGRPVLVALIGAVTLLLAAASALAQWDIKRVLAWSTISQIGYMFLALGVGAWSAAIFHFHDPRLLQGPALSRRRSRDHGPRRRARPPQNGRAAPGAAGHVLDLSHAGAASLVGPAPRHGRVLQQGPDPEPGLELSGRAARWLWAAGLAGAFLTGLYTFRMVFLAFFGEAKNAVSERPGPAIMSP